MERTTPDARALVDQLRERAQARTRPWHPDPLPGPPYRIPMTAHEGLKHLHENWALPDHFDAPGASGGPKWKQLVWRAAGRVTGAVLQPYLSAERELVANMVRLCDAMAKRLDAVERDIDTLAQAASRQTAEIAARLAALGSVYAISGIDDTPGGSTPGGSTPGDRTPDDGAPKDRTLADGTSDDRAPGDSAPGNRAPGDGGPGAMPGAAAGSGGKGG